MKFNRLLATTTFLLTTAASTAQFTDVINSNRPGESMGAFSVGKTVIQAEAGPYFIREKHDKLDWESKGWGMDLNVRYGAFFEQLELILDAQYQSDEVVAPLKTEKRNGFKQLSFGAKYLVYDPNKNYERKPNLYSWKANHKFHWHDIIPAVGVYGGFNFNINNPYVSEHEEKVNPKLMVLTQNQFGRTVVVLNFYADRIITNYLTLGYVATVTFGINERWSAFLENQGYKSDYHKDNILRGGAAFLIKENFQVDLSAGTNFREDPSLLIVGAGVSWRFDENYQEVYLRVPNDDKGKKEDKEKKKKDKKKRKDGIDPDTGEPTE